MKTMKLTLIVVLALVWILAACAPASQPPAAETAIPTEIPVNEPAGQTALGKDPQNATYLIEGKPVTLVNGMAEQEIAPGSASKQVTKYFGNEVQIDLNADGLMDSAFLLTQDGGG